LESAAGIILHQEHGIWHSYVGIALLIIPMALAIFFFEKSNMNLLKRISVIFSIQFNFPYKLRNIIFTVILGSISHVFLDSLTHKSFPNLFFPFENDVNPFWFGFQFALIIYIVVIFLSIYSLVSWIYSSRKKPLLIS
jgi:membrane-bound metal-dependent hydrolase YbcI (DUF457 family)